MHPALHTAVTPQSANSTDIWRPADFSAIELHRGSEVTVEYPRHWHDELYFTVTISGKSDLECAGTTINTPPGQLVIVAPGEVHANQKDACTARTVFLDMAAARSTVEAFIEKAVVRFDFRSELVANPVAAHVFLRMHNALESPQFGLQQQSALAEFLYDVGVDRGTLRVEGTNASREDVAVRRGRQYLEEHFTERVLLEDLVRHTRVSAFHFNRVFRRQIGMPPHAYQLQLRIAHARRLLRAGCSVSETACVVGFFDQSHFVHAFRRSEGITPTQYSRMSKKLQAGTKHTQYFGDELSS